MLNEGGREQGLRERAGAQVGTQKDAPRARVRDSQGVLMRATHRIIYNHIASG